MVQTPILSPGIQCSRVVVTFKIGKKYKVYLQHIKHKKIESDMFFLESDIPLEEGKR